MAQAQRVVREYVQRGHVEQTLQAMPIAAKKLRVAAYCRVSTDDQEQLNSYKTQVDYYTSYIKSKPEWEYVDTYADEYTPYGQIPKSPLTADFLGCSRAFLTCCILCNSLLHAATVQRDGGIVFRFKSGVETKNYR